jgi:hypothetical protein
MQHSYRLAGAILALSLLLSATSAFATTVTECLALINNLKTQTQQVTITGRNAEKELAGLVGKLDAASLALNRAKFCDAIQKLNDYKAKINQPVAAGHINTDPSNGATRRSC